MKLFCYKINKLHLCKPLIRAIESLPIKDKFSLSQLVTYRSVCLSWSHTDSTWEGRLCSIVTTKVRKST
ncbi:pci domain-containing protein 2-like [Plakobranchus ocellatus]|uniref:Pci domain-containing protein 2-like n=1 Tax=Plakobranchus ocellatus TaxID=259542 RepID=A0AAV4DGF8_9GAST|nr:pci domain-containing protein 2-like [Plakobranchus ocellatus]